MVVGSPRWAATYLLRAVLNLATEGHLEPLFHEKKGVSLGGRHTAHQSYKSPTTSKAAYSDTVTLWPKWVLEKPVNPMDGLSVECVGKLAR